MNPLLLVFCENEKFTLIENVKKLKVLQVKEVCKAVGLPLKGNKVDLITRLLQHIEARATLSQNAELLAIQTLVLKLLYNSPLPVYLQLVNAIRTGTVSESSVASSLDQFQRASNVGNLTRQPASVPVKNGTGSNNLMLPPTNAFSGGTLNTNGAVIMGNAMAGMGNVATLNNMSHMTSMGHSMGGMNGTPVPGSHGAHVSKFPGNINRMVPMGGQLAPNIDRMGRSADSELQYTGPMLLFKSTIFYLLRRLVGTVQVLRISKGRNIKSFRIKLNCDEIKLLRENPNMRLYLFSGTESTPDHTNTPIQFPPIEIYVDEALTKQFTKGIKGKPGTARPADLTPYFGLFDKAVLVRVVYSDALEKYIMYTYIVEEFPLEQLSEQIAVKLHISANATRALIKLQNEQGDDDEDIVVATSSLSLRCPLTYARIKQPVRSINCDHIQCFDGPSFLSMQQKIPLWQCSVCSAYIDQNSLAVSDYLMEILSETPESVDSVILNPDGLWRAVESGGLLLDSEDDDSEHQKAIVKTDDTSIKADVAIEIISLDSESDSDDLPMAAHPLAVSKRPRPIDEENSVSGTKNTSISQNTISQQSANDPLSASNDSSTFNPLSARNPQSVGTLTSNATSLTSTVTKLTNRTLTLKVTDVATKSSNTPTANNGNLDTAAGVAAVPQQRRLSRSPLMSDSPLSILSPLSSSEEALPLVENVEIEEVEKTSSSARALSEYDEDAVVAHPRRPAVVEDALEYEDCQSNPSSPSDDYQEHGVKRLKASSLLVTVSSVAPHVSSITPSAQTLAPFSAVSSSAPFTSNAMALGSGLTAKSVNASAQLSELFVPQEGQFMKAMRLLPKYSPNVNPFAPTSSNMPASTTPMQAVPFSSNLTQADAMVVDLCSVLPPSSSAPEWNVRQRTSNQLRTSQSPADQSYNPKAIVGYKPPILPLPTGPLTHSLPPPNTGQYHYPLGSETNTFAISSSQMLLPPGQFYNPMYHQLVHESRAKIKAYQQVSPEDPPQMNLYPLPHSNSPADQPSGKSHLAPSRPQSVSIARHIRSKLAVDSQTSQIDAISRIPPEYLQTPKKRNNSVPGGLRELESTLASPTNNIRPKEGRLNGTPVPTINSQEIGIKEQTAQMQGSGCCQSKFNTNKNNSKDVALETDIVKIGTSGLRFSRNPFEEFPYTERDANDTYNDVSAKIQSRRPSLFTSPVGSAMLELFVTTPASMKRVSGNQGDSTRKRPNQSPSYHFTSAKASTNKLRPTAAGSGKAKFDPSEINAADIIELD